MEINDKIRRIIVGDDLKAEIYGEDGFKLYFGSTAVVIETQEIGEGDRKRIAIEVWAPLLLDVPITDALCRHIATDAHFLWGALRVYAKDGENTGMLTLYYVLLGDFVDPDELLTALYMIASTADGEDDVLQKQFGGRVVDPDGNYE
jgi:hypothetical protein